LQIIARRIILRASLFVKGVSISSKRNGREEDASEANTRTSGFLHRQKIHSDRFGNIHSRTGTCAKALDMLNKALHANEKIFGVDHMETIKVQLNIWVKYLGENHTDTTLARTMLASVHC
jgi:hypothetical protein